MVDKKLLSIIQDKEGYCTDLCLNSDELDMLRKMIYIQWLYRIQLLVPESVHQFDEIGIERYHELSSLIDHSNVWPTYTRVLPREAASLLREMDFFKKLEAEFGWIGIGDEQGLGWDNIYWRLVRPGNDDTGSLHADRWFWDLYAYRGGPPSFSYERLKIWIAIYTVPGKNGLLVVPGSHLKKDWKWHSEIRYDQQKPVIDEDPKDLNIKLLSTEPGRTVLFHDDLLHGGSENLADTTRVSVEFTLFIKKQIFQSNDSQQEEKEILKHG